MSEELTPETPSATEESFYDTPLYGYLACVLLVVLWGLQPFFMRIALKSFDFYTITWVRFTISTCTVLLLSRRHLLRYYQDFKKFPLVLLLGGLCLGANYLTFLKGVELGGPLTAAILIQLGPLALALIGVFVFQESFTKQQMLAVVLAAVGFSAFYYDRLAVANTSGLQTDATIYVIIAAIAWVAFCIVQKQTSRIVGSTLPNLVAYGLSAVLLVVFVDWASFENYWSLSFACVLILSGCTLLAYGALGEAIRTLPVSVVSICVVANPLVTILVVEVLVLAQITAFGVVPLTALGYVGTLCALTGVALATIKSSRSSKAA